MKAKFARGAGNRVELQQRKESPARQRPAGQVFVISTRIRTAPDRSGRVGGQKNRPVAIDLDVPDCMTATDLRKLTSGVVRKLAAGEIRAHDATALAHLVNLLHRILPTAALEERVAVLEQQLAELQSALPNKADSCPSSSHEENRVEKDPKRDDDGFACAEARATDTNQRSPNSPSTGRNGHAKHGLH